MLDKKNKQELIDLMNSLFEEHANALRLHLFELMKQKHQEIELLKDEYATMKKQLLSRRQKDLITADEYRIEFDRINKEESEKMVDLEIKFDDKEKEIKEDLEKNRLQAEAEQKTLLKDRQTQEKLMMFQEILKDMDDKDPIKQYLVKESSLAERELNDYAKKIEKEHKKKVEEMEKEK